MAYLMENKMEVGNIGSTLDILERHKFNIQKKFGQNFLIDNNVLDKIIATAETLKNWNKFLKEQKIRNGIKYVQKEIFCYG